MGSAIHGEIGHPELQPPAVAVASLLQVMGQAAEVVHTPFVLHHETEALEGLETIDQGANAQSLARKPTPERGDVRSRNVRIITCNFGQKSITEMKVYSLC